MLGAAATKESARAAEAEDAADEERAATGKTSWPRPASARARQPNLSFFAFTATPKAKTLELFGTNGRRRPTYVPFHLYSMRQAIEEGFILDVLANYTTYETYFRIEKAIRDDPEYDDGEGSRGDRPVRDAAPAQPRSEGRDHRRALPRAHRAGRSAGRRRRWS